MDDADYTVQLPDFEGPLDLLLHLVKKHELDIFDIPISFITSHYLKMLDAMRALNMDIAGEYLLMAATLAHIKSRELLPREATPDPESIDEDEIDPRQALIKRLLEYQKYKDAAAHLLGRPVIGRNVWNRGAPPLQLVSGEIDTRGPLEEIPVWSLIEALEGVLTRARVPLSHEVTVDRLSLADTINGLTERLEREESFLFESCFAFVHTATDPVPGGLRGQIVITFMAILEMARLRLLRIYQVPMQAPAQGAAAAQASEGQKDEIGEARRAGSIYITRAAGRGPAGERSDPRAESKDTAEPDDGDETRGIRAADARRGG